jgi:hypothetical protein
MSNYHAIDRSVPANIWNILSIIISNSSVPVGSDGRPAEGSGISQYLDKISHGVDAQPEVQII